LPVTGASGPLRDDWKSYPLSLLDHADHLRLISTPSTLYINLLYVCSKDFQHWET